MKHLSLIRVTAVAFLLTFGPGFAGSGDVAEQAFQLRIQGKTDQAIQLLQEDLAVHPDKASTLFELARTQFYLMKFEEAEDTIGRAVLASADLAPYHYFAGMTAAYSLIDAAHKGDENRMKECGGRIISELETAVKIDPENHQARGLLVQQLLVMEPDQGRDEALAEEHARVLEAQDPVWGAKARSNLVDEKQKKELWTSIMADHGDNAQACYEAGEAFIDLGDLDSATDCINKAIQLDPERTQILLRLANAYVMSDDLDQAAGNAERYLGYKHPVPMRAWALAYLGRIRQRMGNADEGQKMVDQALALDPHLWRTFMPPPEVLFETP
jgi:tetratricopeptide (TPR) repeat protein